MVSNIGCRGNTIDVRRVRVEKILKYDPNIPTKALQERFSMSKAAVLLLKKEIKAAEEEG